MDDSTAPAPSKKSTSKVEKVKAETEDTKSNGSKKDKTAAKASGRNSRRSESTEIPIFLKSELVFPFGHFRHLQFLFVM